jgi:hypothetical protein
LLGRLQGSFPRRGGALNERDQVSIEGEQVLRPVFLFDQKMYLGIDFLITSELKLYLIEVNVGLPGGAHEYHLTHLVRFGKPSDIFRRIDWTTRKVYGKTFRDYLDSLPFIESLKPFKI